MTRSEVKPKSIRKALRDVSNNNGGGRSSRFAATGTKKCTVKDKENKTSAEQDEEDGEGKALDRLMLVHSDLTVLIRKIDELVVQAFECKAVNKQGSKEVESFALVLSEMLTSLQPWVPRFQKVLSSHSLEPENHSNQSSVSQMVSTVHEVNESPEQTNLDSLISPSPLVSWRANCTIERGRQLFLLTPLPLSKTLSSKHLDPPKSVFERVTLNTTEKLPTFNDICGDLNDDLLEGVAKEPTPSKHSDFVATETGSNLESGLVSPTRFAKGDCSMVVMTPRLKMSPPKSCMLLEPISESSHRGHEGFRKSTPFPVGFKNWCDSQTSESSGSDGSEGLALKYTELLGIQQAYKAGFRKKQIDASPDWCVSPPKSCALLYLDDETLDNAATACHLPFSGHVLNNQVNLSFFKQDNGQGGRQTNTFCQKEPLGGSLTLIESTPIQKESGSTIQRGKHPGENTLKKELWTKFDAASADGLRLNVSVLQETTRKGFLDRLDEVSCDEET
ncbi:hypothetical protein FNV43_RR06776 [Rhamnella rubrinervis]|uniref:Uncharacterized protein n=1 Tax=Rhamnella rubrinervis TaxID=2594499 RepID=A0A8K0HDN9_9ROSA|nr:hypothetical protein FNV43_RR06776 [Rhamnella rubrinervis]